MRRELKSTEKPILSIHMDYDHLTLGEFGNILIRLQAALRSVADLSPGEYDGRYSEEKPRFIITSVNTKHSVEISTVLAIAAIAMAAPGTIYAWSRFASDVFRFLKATLVAMNRRQIQMPVGDSDEIEISDNENHQIESPYDNNPTAGLKITITRGEVNVKAVRPFLNKLTRRKWNAISNLIWSLTGPARRVVIGDEESQITIEWPNDSDKNN